MDVEAHVAVLEEEGGMLVAAARRAGPEAPVPTCPGWSVADLLAHIGFVHRWAARYVATALTEMVEEPGEAVILDAAPPVPERFDWVEEGHRALVAALRAAPADLRCWTFLAAPTPLAMWARRQMHETTVHRVDAELASGSVPTPAAAEVAPEVAPEVAADGIDELLFGFLGRRRRRRPEVPGGSISIGLEATDRAEQWTVRVSSEAGVEARAGHGDADVAVRATASALYLLLWHRRPLEGLEVSGQPDLFDAAFRSRAITWA